MAQVPVVGLGLGSVAGLGAARLVASHYSVMVKEIAAVFVAGPPVVERLGEPRSKQELGGWQIQLRCGAVDHAVDTEDEAFEAARRFLSVSAQLDPRCAAAGAGLGRSAIGATKSLIAAIPKVKKQAYHMRRIIALGLRQGQLLRDGRAVRPVDHHRLCPSGRLARRGDGG